MQRAPLLFAWLCLLIATTTVARAEDWQAERPFIAVSSQHVYVVGASKPVNSKLPEIRFWVAELAKIGPEALPISTYQLEPIIGEPSFALADKESLRLLFSDLSLFRYDLDDGAATDALFAQQSDLPPLAVVGDATARVSWFLVETDGLLSPSATTRPATSAPAMPGAPPTRLTLLRLKRGFWTRFPVPDALTSKGNAYAMAAREGRLALVVATPNKPLRVATWADESWSTVEAVVDTDNAIPLCAGYVKENRLAIACANAIAKSEAESGTNQRIRVAQQTDRGWQVARPIRDGSELLSLNPTASSLAWVSDKLAIARARSDGRIGFALAGLEDDAVARFAPLSNTQEMPATETTTWGQFVRTLVALGILTVVWSSRRNEILRAATLPKGFMPAPVWKRGVGALIDLALPFAAWFLIFKWQDEALWREVVIESTNDPTVNERLQPWWFALVSFYGLFCYTWEALGHASMGKRILNCRILSADGTAATGRQLFMRNLVRVVMLSLGEPGILATIMMLMIFTRNNQRIGDLAANTIVVHPIPKWMEELDLYPPDRDDD